MSVVIAVNPANIFITDSKVLQFVTISATHTDVKVALDEWYIKTEQKRIVTNIEYEAIMTRVNELVEIVDDHTPVTDKNLIELDFLTDLVVACRLHEGYKSN